MINLKTRIENKGFYVDARYIPVRARSALLRGLELAAKQLKKIYRNEILSGQYLKVGRRNDENEDKPHLRDLITIAKDGYGFRVDFNTEYAEYLDEGRTGSWDIFPVETEWLRFKPYRAKKYRFSKHVVHPGLEPTNFIDAGLDIAESRIKETIVDEIMAAI